MLIHTKLYATFRKYAPQETSLGESFEVDLNGVNIRDLIRHLGIPKKEQILAMVNGIRITDLEHRLQPNDLVVIFPVLGGG